MFMFILPGDRSLNKLLANLLMLASPAHVHVKLSPAFGNSRTRSLALSFSLSLWQPDACYLARCWLCVCVMNLKFAPHTFFIRLQIVMGVFSASSFSLFASHATTSNHFEPARSANTLDRPGTSLCPHQYCVCVCVSHFLLSGPRVCQRYVGVEYFRACVCGWVSLLSLAAPSTRYDY